MLTLFLKENTKVSSYLASSLSFKIKTPRKICCPVVPMKRMKGWRCNQCQTEGFQRHKNHWLDNELPSYGQRMGCLSPLSIIDTYLPDRWRSSSPFHSCLPLISLQLHLYRAVLDFVYSQVCIKFSFFKLSEAAMAIFGNNWAKDVLGEKKKPNTKISVQAGFWLSP